MQAYATAKRLPIARLQAFGLSTITYNNRPAVRIPYRGQDGRDDGPVRFRLALEKGPEGDQRFAWKRGSKLSLYGLDRLAEARTRKYVAIVEGESDCHTCWCWNLPAVGLPGAASWQDAWSQHFADIDTIYVVIEPDAGGAAVLERLSSAAIRDRVRLVRISGHKDVNALHLANPDHFPARWRGRSRRPSRG